MKVKSLLIAGAALALSGSYAFAECGGHVAFNQSMAKKQVVAQSTKVATPEVDKIDLASIKTDAWLIKYLS